MITSDIKSFIYNEELLEQDIQYLFSMFNQHYSYLEFKQKLSLSEYSENVLFVPINEKNIFISNTLIAQQFKYFLYKNKNKEKNPKIHTFYCNQLL